MAGHTPGIRTSHTTHPGRNGLPKREGEATLDDFPAGFGVCAKRISKPQRKAEQVLLANTAVSRGWLSHDPP